MFWTPGSLVQAEDRYTYTCFMSFSHAFEAGFMCVRMQIESTFCYPLPYSNFYLSKHHHHHHHDHRAHRIGQINTVKVPNMSLHFTLLYHLSYICLLLLLISFVPMPMPMPHLLVWIEGRRESNLFVEMYSSKHRHYHEGHVFPRGGHCGRPAVAPSASQDEGERQER
jgi:hypothetical protein